MKKILFFAATAALAFSSCSNEEEIQGTVQTPSEEGAVAFGVSMLRDTRAEASSKEITQAACLANAGGFGVFAYEQGKAGFSSFNASTSYPNFMYNQNVYGYETAGTKKTNFEEDATPKWEYKPVKYYSNNEGAKHSFFAYAPYMDNDHLSPVFTLGKAPAIRYNASEKYDLMWAAPTIDKEKAAIDEKINFNFKHALAQVKFNVAPFINTVHPAHTLPSSTVPVDQQLAKGTHVTVKSIRFVGNVPSQGLLDLEAGKWTIENAAEGEYLINVNNVKWGRDDQSVEITAYDETIDPIKVIPSQSVKIEIVYDVETLDATRPNGVNNHKETNKIVSKESFNLESGKSYTFNLDLGLTSVKFDANVTDWDTGWDSTVDLPNNHDFHAVRYVVLNVDPSTSTTITEKENKSDVDAAGTYYLKHSGELWTVTGTSPDFVWAKTGAGIYKYDNKIYVADGTGACEVYDTWKEKDGKYYVNSTTALTGTNDPVALISITPRSDGKVQKTTGEWVTPKASSPNTSNGEAGPYFTVGSFLYKYAAAH